MKLKSLFFILSFCMIGLTSMASTPLMEQKQKTTICKAIVSSVIENVVNEYQVATVLKVSTKENDINVVQFKNVTETSLAIITDVGWRNSKQRFSNIPHTEKMLPNSIYKNKLKLIKKVVQIIDNPFAVNQSFIIKRYC